MARGDVLEIVTRPITMTLLLLGILALAAPPLVRRLSGRRPAAASVSGVSR